MSAPRLLLLIPPLTQLNTPYPSAAYLTGFLKRHGYATGEAPVSAGAGGAGVVVLADVGIEMAPAMLFPDGLMRAFSPGRSIPSELAGGTGQTPSLEQADRRS